MREGGEGRREVVEVDGERRKEVTEVGRREGVGEVRKEGGDKGRGNGRRGMVRREEVRQ